VVRRTPSGRARELALTGQGEPVRLAASSFRFAIGRALGFNTVRSDRWEAALEGGRLSVQGIGEGHGVGLCQAGAAQMAAEGRTYREILAFYFPGTLLARAPWTRLSGESVTLLTLRPDQDRAVLAIAERQLGEIARQTGLPSPGGIEIRVYPDLDSFRDATAEPGWVAAHTSGRRIDLQPVSVLRSRNALESTVRHELLHAVLEAQAAPGLPVWFREGLAGYLSEGGSGSLEAAEADIRRRDDETLARSANRAATARVRELVRRHGLSQVIFWLRNGL
jgi:stage II sporulation protein D